MCTIGLSCMSKGLCLSKRFECEEVLTEDHKWMPKIFMHGGNGNLVDFVPFLDPTVVQEAECFTLGYPRSSSFVFDGYYGTQQTDLIIEAIKASAFQTGSRIRASKRKVKSPTRKASIDFFCVKSKQFFEKKRTCIQSNNMGDIGHNKKGKKRKRRSDPVRPVHKNDCCGFGFTIFCSATNDKWYLSFSKK